jgi:hypothetical protein
LLIFFVLYQFSCHCYFYSVLCLHPAISWPSFVNFVWSLSMLLNFQQFLRVGLVYLMLVVLWISLVIGKIFRNKQNQKNQQKINVG